MDEQRLSGEPVFSKPFNGTKARYRTISIIAAIYTSVSIYLIFALTRYYWLGDASVFEWQTFVWVPVFAVFYAWFSYGQMVKYDGVNSKGTGWKFKSAKVKLVEQKQHKRFG